MSIVGHFIEFEFNLDFEKNKVRRLEDHLQLAVTRVRQLDEQVKGMINL